ncbi:MULTISPECIES: hypothetical protein [unclassified Streptomyces]|uniref:hypothetical protein n=1 Tax=unclassified Streptomyces TaxID=2593676 RepID=UPI001CC1A57F|nr:MULTISPECIES: hypothetical protein [unclassified Streptomyces]WPO69146.1 hypothetical protein R9806_00070 [Streptomyces sp. KN37]
MRRILTSVGTLAAAGLLTVGLTTSAGAATGQVYVAQGGQTTVYNNPPTRTCIKSDPTKGDVTFTNRLDDYAYLTDASCTSLFEEWGDPYLRRGQTRTKPAGVSVMIRA